MRLRGQNGGITDDEGDLIKEDALKDVKDGMMLLCLPS